MAHKPSPVVFPDKSPKKISVVLSAVLSLIPSSDLVSLRFTPLGSPCNSNPERSSSIYWFVLSRFKIFSSNLLNRPPALLFAWAAFKILA